MLPRLLSHSGDYLELDRDRCGQRRDLDRCAGRVWFGLACEILGVNAVVDGKILFHVSEKDRDVDDVLPGRASVDTAARHGVTSDADLNDPIPFRWCN